MLSSIQTVSEGLFGKDEFWTKIADEPAEIKMEDMKRLLVPGEYVYIGGPNEESSKQLGVESGVCSLFKEDRVICGI